LLQDSLSTYIILHCLKQNKHVTSGKS
jgi:hypothetical protein